MNFEYVCIECGERSQPDFFKLKCSDSDQSCFDIKYNEQSIGKDPILPLDKSEIVSMGEGGTPGVSLKNHFPELKDLICKLEYFSPTSSFKDRGSSILISAAKKYGVNEFVEDSSGNAGASMSAYAAMSGIKANIFAPESTPKSKLDQINIFGAKLHKIAGPRQESTTAARNFCDLSGIPYLSHNYNPFFIEGMKSFAYEIFNDYGQSITDIVIPVGNGSLLIGAQKGFDELKKLGKINISPKLHCVQVEGFSPISNKFNNNDWKFDQSSKTLAGGIAVTTPPRITQVLQCIKNSGSEAIIVSESSILGWHNKLALLGILSEITCAAAFSGVEQLKKMNIIGKDSKVLVPVTGSGLKDLANAKI